MTHRSDTYHRPAIHLQFQHRLSRRSLLTRVAALSVGALAVGALAKQVVPVVARAGNAPVSSHGVALRGMHLPKKSRRAEGRFGLMFKRLPAHAPPSDLLTVLGRTMMEEQPPAVPDDTHLNTNPRLFAGFTFIGQFIDHDITFDPTPLELQQRDPDAQVHFRTPRLNLDSVYGGGPTRDPERYDPSDPDKLLVTTNVNGVLDVPRDATSGRALIPEPRNDDNLILVQLHLGVIRFHNAMVNHVRTQVVQPEKPVRGRRSPQGVFETARRLTCWHVQWAAIHDFLPRVVGEDLIGPNGEVYKDQSDAPPVITLNYYKPTNRGNRPFLPVEFTAAAFRFGHSLIRPFYIINTATAGGVPIFGLTPGFNLNGGRPIPADLVVEWKNILEVDATSAPRKPRKIDTKLSLPLFNLPASVVPPPDPETLLAVRNLLRGKEVGLPSGQRVAQAMRTTVLSNAQLGLSDPAWEDEAPLWYYILKEAELLQNAERLGPVGGRIVAEVLVGLLQYDQYSYLSLDPTWKPAPPIASLPGQFTFVDLLRFAGAA